MHAHRLVELKSFTEVDYQANCVVTIEADGYLRLHYRLAGNLENLVWPPPTAMPGARDLLYQTTCFEAFVNYDGERYCEINASPSGNWQYFFFTSYRQQGKKFAIAPPEIIPGVHELTVRVPWPGLNVRGRSALRVGISAVIEFSERKDYWALEHCGDKPDFHRSDSFTLNI
jgi:hypothetical protein